MQRRRPKQLTKTDFFEINQAMPRNTVMVATGVWSARLMHLLDASPCHALHFSTMATIKNGRLTPLLSAGAPPPFVLEKNPSQRQGAAAISEMMPEVYDDLR